MRDVFEAIEHLSALLSMRTEAQAGKRGWICKVTDTAIEPAPGRTIHLIGLTINLPQGLTATFAPRPQPAGDSWLIEVHRSDGVNRRSWAGGMRVSRLGGRYVLQRAAGGEILPDEAINALLDDLARPGPAGVAIWIRKAWAIRFGKMPREVSELLDQVKDVDQLDRMHALVLRAPGHAEAAAQLVQLAAVHVSL